MDQDQFSYLGRSDLKPLNYDANILDVFERSLEPRVSEVFDKAVVSGIDLWQFYEISFLLKGVPYFTLGCLLIPFSSLFIVESKSFKLYFNSLNGADFDSIGAFKSFVERDLSAVLGVAVQLRLYQYRSFEYCDYFYSSLDHIKTVSLLSHYSSEVLRVENNSLSFQRYYTRLFRSLCPVTGQPDWASIYITCYGPVVDQVSLLTYLLSFRQHGAFHESVVDLIYSDLFSKLNLSYLTVFAKFNRRGGIDINPFRSNFESFSLPCNASYSQ